MTPTEAAVALFKAMPQPITTSQLEEFGIEASPSVARQMAREILLLNLQRTIGGQARLWTYSRMHRSHSQCPMLTISTASSRPRGHLQHSPFRAPRRKKVESLDLVYLSSDRRSCSH